MTGAPDRPRVAHVITGLGVGGAERMLVKILNELADRYDFHVICLGNESALVPDVEATGAAVHVLGLENHAHAALTQELQHPILPQSAEFARLLGLCKKVECKTRLL